ncbi:MAG TPA: nitrite/sulfite reductase, partial [Thermoleophilaceae bacterium]
MEPTSVRTEEEKTRGRPGSLENPEVHENVPGHVIPILEREFDDFDTRAAKFMRGEEAEDQFIGFRLKQGVYGQRQPDAQMIRVKLPFGGVSPEQLDAFAEAAELYTPLRKGHITTRQNIQYHHVPLPDAAKLIRLISEAGLSSREACGNTVRNVTGDPWAGVAHDEPYDITPYAGAFVRYFVRNEVCQLLPRKFKVAFTASDQDRAITLIHDLGFLPRVRDGVRGVEIRTGGGTSIMARVGSTLFDFVEVDNGDFLKVSEAVLRVFDRRDELRANRQRARLKFYVDRIGIDAFREVVEEELRGDWVHERDFNPQPLLFVHDEEAHAPDPPVAPGSPNGDGREFEAFVASNVRPQRQDGFSTVEVKVTRGDLSPEQFRGLAQVMRDFSGGYARTSIHQNLILRWVRDEALYDVWRRLAELGLGDAGADQIADVLSCPGTDSCKMGITSSMGLNQAVQERVESMNIEDPLTKRIHIKMSGCPNGCGQHHIGTIGFYGASMKVGGRQIPAYIAHVGGRYDEGEVKYGVRLKVRLAAKRVPEAVERWLRLYEAERNDGEEFNAFVERVGTARFEEEVAD